MKNNELEAPCCVQCGREMVHGFGNEHFRAQFCTAPDCPNYSLLCADVRELEVKKEKHE